MSKHVIPNQVGHYELSGIEVDVYDKQIIIRTSFSKENQKAPEKKSAEKKESNIADTLGMGPVTRKILGLK